MCLILFVFSFKVTPMYPKKTVIGIGFAQVVGAMGTLRPSLRDSTISVV